MTLRSGQHRAPPLIILGMDAGDAGFIQQWAQEGHLPTLARLLNQGCHGSLLGPEMASEHGTGISMWSGVSRGRHGYYDIRQLEPRSYDLVPCTAARAKALPFWACLKDTGKRIAVIDAYEGLVQPGVAGLQLYGWAAHQSEFPALPAAASPAELLPRLRRQFGPAYRPPDYVPNSVADDRRTYHALLKAVARKGELCRHLLSQGSFDLVVVMFAEMHWAAHRFWPYRPEARGERVRPGDEILTHAIRDMYRAIDQEFATLLRLLPEDANVFFVCMYGMANHYPTTGLIENFCRTLGYQATPQPGKASFSALSLARRLMPLPLRRLAGRFISASVYHRILANQFRQGTDWSRTTAFTMPALFDSFLRVNLRGREPAGIVEPGREYAELLDNLEADLKRLIDPVTGEPAVAETLRCVDLFGDVSDDLPDLFVHWRPHTHFLRRVVHPRGEIVQHEPQYLRDSNHSKNGLLIAAGPAIQARSDVGELVPLDLAPTCLSLLGEPVPAGMTGTVMSALLEAVDAGAKPRTT